MSPSPDESRFSAGTVAVAVAALALTATLAVATTLLLTSGDEDASVAEPQPQTTTVVERAGEDPRAPAHPDLQPESAPPQPESPEGASDWPQGTSGWTTILASMSTRERAETVAAEAAAAGVPDPGVLPSNDHSSLSPGLWVVFSGQLSREEAAARAQDVRERGFGDAYPRFVSAG